jgi:hypothetical protein
MQKRIRTFEVGFSGIVATGWVVANQNWTKYKSNGGQPFDAMQVLLKRIANQVMYPVVLGNARHF